MKVQLNTETIRQISLFQQITGAHALDMITNEEIYFVVAENEYGLAIGKDGKNIRKAEHVFKKPIRIVEYSPDIDIFIRSMIPQTREIVKQDGKIEVRVAASDRAKVIGKAGYRIKIMEEFVKRFFDAESFKVK
ncbi:MAG: NusA-like transcription termination signal-binding factor [Candidatus Aenigmarchaeota archaeon]|nr:NusA-like transcription termination signal-binding factor [Candidatus Aenigmarchaeota archaeon]